MRKTRIVIAGSLLLAVTQGCAQREATEAATATQSLAVTAGAAGTGVLTTGSNGAILGFEDPSLWTPTGGQVASSAVHTQGAKSLAATPGGYMTFKSAQMAMTGAPKQIAFDLQLPAQQSNPYWYGQVQLYIDCPSRGVFNAYVGAQELTGMPLQTWQTLSFTPPDSVVAALDGQSYNDLTLTIAVNVATPAGAYLFDNLRMRGPTQVPLGDTVAVDPQLGTPTIISPPDGQTLAVTATPANPSDPGSVAIAFVQSYPGTYAMSNPAAEFSVSSVTNDTGPFATVGGTHVRLQQVYQGLPVFEAQAVVHLTSTLGVAFASGHTAPTPSLSTTPALTAAQADSAALASLPQDELAFRAQMNLPTVSSVLGVYVPAIYGETGAPVLAFRSETLGYVSIVSASNGALLLQWSTLESARNRQTYDYNAQSSLSSATLVETESSTSCPAGADQDVCNIHSQMGVTYDFYKDTFGRDSDNNKGATIVSGGDWVAYNSSMQSVCPNAFSSLVFCQGVTGQDVITHEFTHRVTGYTAKLLTSKESGALNESYSDVMGSLSNGDNPNIGSSTIMGTIRSLKSPEDHGQPWNYDQTDWSIPQHEVHWNNGVPNHAAWLMMAGGTRDGITVDPIGFGKTGQLYYQTLTSVLSSTDTMPTMAADTLQTCSSLFSKSDCNDVWTAFIATRLLGKFVITNPPVGGSNQVNYGGFGVTSTYFSIDASARSDSTWVPTVKWASNVEGPMFVKDPQLFIFSLPLGPRDITATTTFPDGHTITAHTTIEVINSPPTPAVTNPPDDSTTALDGSTVTLQGNATDPNEITGLPCSSLQWSSNVPGDTLSASSGCSVEITFAGAGQRQITLTATDSQGAAAVTTRLIQVQPASSNSPPVPAIVQPSVNFVDASTALALSATAFDPRGDTNLTYTWGWSYTQTGTPLPIGTGQTLSWTPSNTVPFSCGGSDGFLVLTVTDSSNLSGTVTLPLHVFYPTC